MSKFNVYPREWKSAEDCLNAFFEDNASVHLYKEYHALGGGMAGSCGFITEKQLEGRVYTVFFLDSYLAIHFHDTVFIRDIKNRIPYNTLNSHCVHIRIPMAEKTKEA